MRPVDMFLKGQRLRSNYLSRSRDPGQLLDGEREGWRRFGGGDPFDCAVSTVGGAFHGGLEVFIVSSCRVLQFVTETKEKE